MCHCDVFIISVVADYVVAVYLLLLQCLLLYHCGHFVIIMSDRDLNVNKIVTRVLD